MHVSAVVVGIVLLSRSALTMATSIVVFNNFTEVKIHTYFHLRLPPVRNVHRVDGVAVVSLTANVDVCLIINKCKCAGTQRRLYLLSMEPHMVIGLRIPRLSG